MCCRQQLVLYSQLICDTEWLIAINIVTGGVLCRIIL